ncbi:MAG: hypothetical protein GF416_08405 [Candidatus Altiarchaeales archaeon]|nr:hypothetical protein [Candidatus Altiarchaeales archaeon]MBD3417136.1 hypothetical protein [Candidatus Altiarchaeales archaeon]
MKKSALFLVVGLVLLSGCLCGTPGDREADTTSATQQIVCNRPYIRVGGSCCLDRNNNMVCDSDEQETAASTTLQPRSTTTLQSSDSMSTSPDALCNSDGDCGGPDEIVVCNGDNVVKLTVTYRCVYPGSPKAECMGSTEATTLDTCDADETCYYGVCVEDEDAEDYPTTTVAPSAPTTTVAPTTTTVAAAPTTTLAGATTTTTLAAATTTTVLPGATTTTMGLALPCDSIMSWSSMQCVIRSCPPGQTCVFMPNINPMLPGSCSCKTLMTTTTTLPSMPSMPCSGFPAFSSGACAMRSCPIGMACVYSPPSGMGLWGSCSCEPSLVIATSTTLPVMPKLCSTLSAGACSLGSCSPGQSCKTKYISGLPIGCECKPDSTTTTTLMGVGGLGPLVTVYIPTTTTLATLGKQCGLMSSSKCSLGICDAGEACLIKYVGGVPAGCSCKSVTTTTMWTYSPMITVVMPGGLVSTTTTQSMYAPVTLHGAILTPTTIRLKDPMIDEPLPRI